MPTNELAVHFFWNGNTAVFRDGQQVPELQESWLVKFVEFLESKGEDPQRFEFHLPNGSIAKLHRLEGARYRMEGARWNWEIQ